MLEFVLLGLLLIVSLGWWRTWKRLMAVSHAPVREMTEILPEVARGAWTTMHSTLFSISAFAPFADESASDGWDASYTTLGLEYREALHACQRDWFERTEVGLTPLEYGKGALAAFDGPLTKYRKQIDEAHARMMKHYGGRPMPIRDQNGFNWVKLW